MGSKATGFKPLVDMNFIRGLSRNSLLKNEEQNSSYIFTNSTYSYTLFNGHQKNSKIKIIHGDWRQKNIHMI